METIKHDCQYFRGDIPCKPHKEYGYHCNDCPVYQKITHKILIIKLGAIGDIIRSTPILRRLKQEYPGSRIYWLTYSPEVLSREYVDHVLEVSFANLEIIKNLHFDRAINLDKENLAISLMNSVKADLKQGFEMDEFGHCTPIGKNEEHKWLTGLFDDLNKANTKNYMEEIFEIAGYKFHREEYILEDNIKESSWNLDYTKSVVGLNTGCGERWLSRLWPEDYWIKLAKDLSAKGYEVLLLGGASEDEKNRRIAEVSGVKYFGHYDLKTFINEVNQTDIVVTAVTMATHIAIGLKKTLILFNNIFNKNEFYLYNRGEILEPEMDCDCFFSPECPNECMKSLYPESVLESIEHWENNKK